jgi:hypothetical protein
LVLRERAARERALCGGDGMILRAGGYFKAGSLDGRTLHGARLFSDGSGGGAPPAPKGNGPKGPASGPEASGGREAIGGDGAQANGGGGGYGGDGDGEVRSRRKGPGTRMKP